MATNPCFLGQVTKRDIAKLPQEDVDFFWRYAKENGIFKGLNPDETRTMIAGRFNIPERVVSWIMDRNKTARVLSEEARARQKATAGFLASNRRWLANYDKTGIEKLWNFLDSGTRRITLAWHGPVPPVTHALDVAVTNPVQFIKMWGRGVLSVSPRYADRVMAKLATEPYYNEALKAGLPIGKEDISTEGFPKTGWAARAMDAALKPLRYKLWENKWKSVLQNTPEDATPEMAQKLAFEYAHATGSLVKNELADRITSGFRRMTLAPQLTPSKIMKSIFDPIETVKTIERTIESKIPRSPIRPPTPEERIVAWNRIQRSARWFGGTLGALAVNEAYLRATGSQQHVNYDKPERSDWMAFKFGGHMYRMRGTMEILGLIARVSALGMKKYKYGQQTPEDALGRYGEYKLAPGIGISKELLTGKDVFGRPAPWSSDPGTRQFPRKNWIEEVGQHGPIFIGHAITSFNDTLRSQGVDTRVSMNVLRAITNNPPAAIKAAEEAALEGGAEFFGVNIQPDRYIGR